MCFSPHLVLRPREHRNSIGHGVVKFWLQKSRSKPVNAYCLGLVDWFANGNRVH